MADNAEHLRRWNEEGWIAERTGGGHLRLTHPEASGPVFTACTPSDWRALLNTEARMRRALGQNITTVPKVQDIRQVNKKSKPRRDLTPVFEMPVRFPPMNAFGKSRLPGPGEWTDDTDLSSSADPMEITLAWGFAYMRLRAEGKDFSLIRVLRERYRRDEIYRAEVISAFRASSPTEFQALRRNSRSGVGVKNEKSIPVLRSATVVTLPVQSSVEIFPPTVAGSSQEPSLEDRIKTLRTEIATEKQLRVTAETELKDQRFKRLHAEAARDDAFKEIAEIKNERRALLMRVRELENELVSVRGLYRIAEEKTTKLDAALKAALAPKPTPAFVVPVPVAVKKIVPVQTMRKVVKQPETKEPLVSPIPERTIGQRIRQIRLLRGLSQVELAYKCSSSGPVISSFETGRKEPSDAQVAAIAKVFRISVLKLRGD